MSCTMHVASTIYVSHSLKAQKKNNSSPDAPNRLDVRKTISVSIKWLAAVTNVRVPLKIRRNFESNETLDPKS